MKQNYISKVLKKFFSESQIKENEDKFREWLVDTNFSEEKDKSLHEYWDSINPETDKDIHESLKQVKNKLNIDTDSKRRQIIFAHVRRIAAVLISIIIIVAGYLLYGNYNEQYINLLVMDGKREQLVLPDSSIVWVNSDSKLKYPQKFKEEDSRFIELDGEAFFKIKKEQGRPFFVKLNNLTIEVIGTEFNISAYNTNKQILVTLNKGKIKIKTNDNSDYILEPDQQFRLNNLNSQVEIVDVDANDFSGWRSGKLIYNELSLSEITLSLNRTFNVQITLDKSILVKEDKYSIKFVNNESIEDILKILSDVAHFAYKINGNHITIIPD
jgi:ferric-dicitrate binding protein FerR (iron transport regulator)